MVSDPYFHFEIRNSYSFFSVYLVQRFEKWSRLRGCWQPSGRCAYNHRPHFSSDEGSRVGMFFILFGPELKYNGELKAALDG